MRRSNFKKQLRISVRKLRIQDLENEIKSINKNINEKILKARELREQAKKLDNEVNALFIEKAKIKNRINKLKWKEYKRYLILFYLFWCFL